LVVVDVVVGVHGARGQGELFAKGLVEVVRPGLVGDMLGDGGVGGGFSHVGVCVYLSNELVRERRNIFGETQCWNI